MRGSTSAELWWDGTQFYPGADDSYHLGHSSYRFDNIYATNGTIQTANVTTSAIQITEIVYNTPSTDWEWVELYNPTGSAIDLSTCDSAAK